ncbi:MFS transporter [Streptacidiphilus jiangxiensis]|uniref:Predicted arabinose efflux permease, MFS family n=1 Tax=Streptacidiphilus jiangxiensis TaxID=235985 RepID=A0A1H7R0J1_STRJI|nr:MFS transporter [Streptacidiphilus jiangxiensis]SEL53435.1 Predicted arabinose efflux permease, MFS family [Streptacidiphilus jiangxiensis]
MTQTGRPSRRLTLVLAVVCGVAVGNVYFPQALTPVAAASLHVPADAAALAVTATQVGYTVGIVLLAPLSDRLPNRSLLVALLVLSGAGLVAAGCAPALPVLVVAGGLVGLTSVAAQVVGPLAASLTAADRQGSVIGILLSGSTGGMLLARAFSGTLGQWLGWRAPYLVAAAATLLLAAVVRLAVPPGVPPAREPYRTLLTEPLRLLRAEPSLRHASLNQAAVFGGFSAAWTGLAFLLTGPSYRLGAASVGTFALVGAATMCCTPFVGRLVDRRGPDGVNLVCIVGVLASAALLVAGTGGGAVGLAALTFGMLLLDVAMQSGMVANQARVYALRPNARGRLKTAYMTCAYSGGSAGSWLGAQLWGRAGWPGVCALLALLAGLALTGHLLAVHRRSSGAAEAPAPANGPA